MEESHSKTDSSKSRIEDNPEEIGWVSYGMLATGTMVIYQFFLVYFMNIPSTISVKITLSFAIGILAVIITSIVKLVEFWKSCIRRRGNKKKMRSSMNEIYYEEESESENEAIGRKNSLWKYVTSFVQKVK